MVEEIATYPAARFAEDFLAALRLGQQIHGRSVNDIVRLAGVSRGAYYALLAQPQVPRWPNAVALAAATGWRMDLVIAPLAGRQAPPAITATALQGHPLPAAPEVAAAAGRCVRTIRRQAAAAVLMGLAQHGWSLRQAAEAAQMNPTKPSSFLTTAHGPDPAALAQLLGPLGYDVSVWYRPWGAPDLPVLVRPTRTAALRVRSSCAPALAMLTRLSPTLGRLAQDPDAATIAAAYAQRGSIPATATALQVSTLWLRTAMTRYAIPVLSTKREFPAVIRLRNHRILREVNRGQTYAQIGAHYGITGSRVQQIVQKLRSRIRAVRQRQRRQRQRSATPLVWPGAMETKAR